MDETPRPDLVEEVRIRLPLPIVIPVGALVVIAGATIGFAEILLHVPKHVAVALALVMALNVLGACAFVAIKPKVTTANWAELFIVVTYPIIIGAVLTQTGIVDNSASAEEKPPATTASEAPPAAGLALVASGLAWDADVLAAPAGKPFAVKVTNEDTTVHNFSIYADGTLKEQLLDGQDVPAGATVEEKVDQPIDKGEYYFQCDYHPTMSGTLEVK
jgi:plastocyanin